ncbi:MAG: segregation and condensation protein [Frankiaceae bacterium]|jgi:segregation and condensation protein A|nr:segregation and condensation protein [Frankiaceae bacterium]
MPTDMPADIPPDAPVLLGQAPFAVHLDNYEGPFDLLLGLIAKHKLDVTEVALSQVTDEFISFIRAAGDAWDLGQATQFLVIAATLLDLKAARLLPAGSVEDEEDIALLEARDLLFARLLQYRAYKEAAAFFAARIGAESQLYARDVSLEPAFAAAIPEVLLGIGPGEFAMLAAAALAPRSPELVSLDHVHAPLVSVREQAILLAERLSRLQSATFRSLVSDCADTVSVVARFLALLELYRDGQVAFEQVIALGDLQIRWTGGPHIEVAHFEEYEAAEQPEQEQDR